MHQAAVKGHKEIVELLVAKGADMNVKVESGRYRGETPLDLAIRRKKNETAALLRKHGAKSGAEDSIHIAAMVGNIVAVKKHLDAGADVNAKNNVGETPLDLVIEDDNPETADLLRKHGGKTGAELKASGN